MPYGLNLKDMYTKEKCFISGYKGTGKTALLLYLENYFYKENPKTITVFIPFKENYNEAKRKNMVYSAQRIVSTISIDKSAQIDNQDFEYIWAMEIFKKIIEANGINHGILFEKNESWKAFRSTIKKIEKDKNILKYVLIPSITYTPSSSQQISITASIKPEEIENTQAYQQFITLIDMAFSEFEKLDRTKTPFYIFIDELEAYYGNQEIFTRDLRMIRDLIIIVKRFNTIFWKNKNFHTKIICGFRTEIMHAINTQIISKEINKTIGGFEVPLKWNYNNTNSIEHPIMKILLRRIQIAEHNNGHDYSEIEIYNKWFPEKSIEGQNLVSFILNNTWNKPRDIVRLLMVAQDSIKGTSSKFTRDVFDACLKDYSKKSLEEIREEMLATYSSDKIEEILNPLKGYRVTFTKEELMKHLEDNYEDSIFLHKLGQVLKDLYRLGIIGNYSHVSDSYHWQHKGDEGPLYSNEWQLQIHRALWGAMLISKRHDDAINKIRDSENQLIGNIYEVNVVEIKKDHINVSFTIDSQVYYGIIFIKDIAEEFVVDIESYVWIGEKIRAKVLRYDMSHGIWILSKNI
ncbi:MAG: hypothetical protein VB086_10855 [Clostridiaceae bacterium]|nr:hypothetical protein [Clostridiaceae bacterium]